MFDLCRVGLVGLDSDLLISRLWQVSFGSQVFSRLEAMCHSLFPASMASISPTVVAAFSTPSALPAAYGGGHGDNLRVQLRNWAVFSCAAAMIIKPYPQMAEQVMQQIIPLLLCPAIPLVQEAATMVCLTSVLFL